ncbi:nucleotidyltransferase family protein [Thermomonas sp. S9]|uniref:nucleotidyltransferase family protein n=1 Tax=Thermomonas sp. S9 TaxID=2885203 RepID=UPI00216B30D9|nr:nucleotidyltransferase family protein [Thermomonas sp. S9]MCR6496054.1 nucleotidyltransferase family protein [Thermomonas sp. S9]
MIAAAPSLPIKHARRALAQALLGAPLPLALADADGLALARREGVLPLLEAALRASPQWPELPQAFRYGLQAEVRQAIGLDLFRRHELARAAAALAAGGLRVLLLKGNALGLWLYPQPHLRVTRDIDLLFASRAEADRAVDLLSPLGYEAEPDPGRLFFERKSTLRVDGRSRCELDLHCRLLNAPLFAEAFPFQRLWSQAQPLPGLPDGIRGLSPVHAVLHACLNRVLDIQTGEPQRLKLLFDVHLLAARLEAGHWIELVGQARARGIAGGCLRVFDETSALFCTRFPDDVLEDLRRAAASEALDWTRLTDWRYMQWRNFLAVPGWRARLRWLSRRLLPTHAQLVALYGAEGYARLLMMRCRRFLGHMISNR